ncbi:hypothetical protein [Microvirga aerophila]|uniref:Uncharacterized protein n=1 Tax=Microvirga aerophila TaxID=670291 RepID=A0A512BRH5_9HYPH|nr:hypothetical protein [Microvirga aerophila]GEO14609.1 hypothetical protein MAE02_23050 [Microvirga aerophila]
MAIQPYSDTANIQPWANIWVNIDANGNDDWWQVEWDNGWNSVTDLDQYNEQNWYLSTYNNNPYTGVAYWEVVYDNGATYYYTG